MRAPHSSVFYPQMIAKLVEETGSLTCLSVSHCSLDYPGLNLILTTCRQHCRKLKVCVCVRACVCVCVEV